MEIPFLFWIELIMSAAMGIFIGTQEGLRNSPGKRAISVLATEVLLFIVCCVMCVSTLLILIKGNEF